MKHETATDARPRERLLERGAQALTEAELLAVLLGTGLAGETAETMGRRILEEFRTLEWMAEAGPERLARVRGLGPARAAKLAATFEIARRLAAAPIATPVPIDGPADAARLLTPLLRPQRKEVFALLALDSKGRARSVRVISTGSLTASIVHPREVFGEAILQGAASVIVAHNHPSGDPTPSPEDVAVTRKLERAGEILGIPLLDHIVVGRDGFQRVPAEACERVPSK